MIRITKKKFNTILFIMVILPLMLSGFLIYKINKVDKSINTTKDTQKLIEKVSKIYLIPEGEEPTIASVSDPEAVKNNSFFTLSQKDDKILIFPKAGRAVLYRPSINKIIETTAVNIDTINIRADNEKN